MRAHPVLVGGDGATDTTLMQQHRGVVAKGGAEGLFCASGLGLGLALKVADGNPRALRPALAVLGEQLGLALEAFAAAVPVRNRHGEEAAVVSVL
jgi:L-asparaginase II